MTASPFAAATRLEPSGPDVFVWDVPDGWQQGRGAWGGLVIAAIVGSADAVEPDDRRTVRAVSAQVMAPALVGTHQVRVAALRRGSAMSTWTVDVTGEDGPVARGVVITGSPRTADADDHDAWGTLSRPTAPDPDDVPRVRGGAPFPVFTQHCDMRPITGVPLGGGPAETSGWVGYDVPTPVTAASLLALADAWWPASLPRLSVMPRIATVNVSINLLVPASAVATGELLLHDSFVSAAHEGFTSEQRRLWTADGRLVAESLQTLVIGA